MSQRDGVGGVNRGSAKAVGLRRVAEARSETPSEACRVVDRLVALGQEGMASGIDETFDIDAFVDEVPAGR